MTERGVITITVLMTSIDAKNGVADRVDSGRLGVGPDVVDIGEQPVRKPIEEGIDTQGVEIKAERLELTVLGSDLVHPVPNGILSMNSVLDEAGAQHKGVLSV
jgi:hypothetical protein